MLDSQHKVILSYMAKLYKYLLAGEKEKDLFRLVENLDMYCRMHFLDEEELLEEIGFPETAAHKAQHALFVTHLENFTGRYEEQNITKNIDDLVFLKGWFLEHIKELDKKYADFKKHLDKLAGKSG